MKYFHHSIIAAIALGVFIAPVPTNAETATEGEETQQEAPVEEVVIEEGESFEEYLDENGYPTQKFSVEKGDALLIYRKTRKKPILRQEKTVYSESYEGGLSWDVHNRGFVIGIPGGTLSGEEASTLVMRRLPKWKVSFKNLDKEKYRLKSRIYHYNIDHSAEGAEFDGPVWLNVKLRGKMKHRKDIVLMQYLPKEQQWVELEDSTVGAKKRRVRATVTEDKMIIAAFRDRDPEEVYTGQASWYRWHGSAMNVFEIGDVVIVTDPATGKEAETTIVSRGPYVEGRIIDLPTEIFEVFAPLSQGVINGLEVRKKD